MVYSELNYLTLVSKLLGREAVESPLGLPPGNVDSPSGAILSDDDEMEVQDQVCKYTDLQPKEWDGLEDRTRFVYVKNAIEAKHGESSLPLLRSVEKQKGALTGSTTEEIVKSDELLKTVAEKVTDPITLEGGTPSKSLTVNVDKKTLDFAGTRHDVQSLHALLYVGALERAEGGWVAKSVLADEYGLPENVNVSVLKDCLPPAIAGLIETKRGRGGGSRLVLPTV